MTTLNLQVGDAADDAYQNAADAVDVGDFGSIVDSDQEHIGLRWQGVTIPQGWLISSAYLTVVLTGTAADEPKHRLRGEASDDAAVFTTTTNDIDARPRTSESVTWDVPDLGASASSSWQWGAAAGDPTNGADLSGIIQEIIDRAGWASGNALALIYEQPSLDALRDLAISPYDINSPQNAAKLDIDYTEPPEPVVARTEQQLRTTVRR